MTAAFDPRVGVEPSPCPECGRRLDATECAEGPAHTRPSAGDVSICAYCAAVLVFDAAGRSVRPSAEQLAELRASPDVQREAAQVRARLRAGGWRPSHGGG